MAGPEDEVAAGAAGPGQFRTSQVDREQTIEVLKTAFAEDRLTKDELDLRVGQALASRTYAELAAITADIPAGPAAAPPPRQPARAQNRAPGSHTRRNVAIGLGIGLIIAAAIVLGGLLQYSFLLVPLAFPFIVVLPFILVANSQEQRRSRGQLPPRPGQGGQAPRVQQADQACHDPALPRDRLDQIRADLRADSSRPGRPHLSGLVARAPRGIRPVPGAV
jgi:hypothetical protein